MKRNEEGNDNKNEMSQSDINKMKLVKILLENRKSKLKEQKNDEVDSNINADDINSNISVDENASETKKKENNVSDLNPNESMRAKNVYMYIVRKLSTFN